VPIFKRGDVWYIYIRRGRGGRIRRTTRTADRKVAQRQHDELAARLWRQKQTGHQFWEALAAWVKARPRNPSEVRAVRLIRRVYTDRPLVDVTEASLIEAFGDRAPATYNRLMTIVRSALNGAVQAEWIDQAPKITRRKATKKSFRWLTRAEWRKLRAELAPHLQRMADVAISTGLRWSNVAGLQWEQVSLERKIVSIGAGEAKGRKALSIPLAPKAIAALRRGGAKRAGFVFTYNGEPLTSPKTGWNAAVKRSGIDPVRWHDLRHTWASWHIQNGTPPMVLKELGGWASLEQVMIYAHLAPSHVARYAANAEKGGPKSGHRRTR
jgi:integrase